MNAGSPSEQMMIAQRMRYEVVLFLRWKVNGILPVRYFCDLPCNLADVFWYLDQEWVAQGGK